MTISRRLGEVCGIIMGQAPSGDSYNSDGNGLPLVAGPGDFDGSVPAPKKYTTAASKVSRTGDIIVGVRASIGDKVLSDGEYCLGRGVAALRPGDQVELRFLWHWLTYNAQSLAAKGRGATFKQVNREDISELLIRLPSKGEQSRIARALDEIDLLRVKRLEAMAYLDNLAVSAFIERFGEGTATPVEVLGQHLTFLTSGGRGWAKYYSKQGERFIRSLDVRMNFIDEIGAVYVQAPDNAEARRTRVQEGDVLLTITGSRIGRVAPVPGELQGAYVSQHVAILRPSKESLRPEFLSFYLSLQFGGQRQISKMQYGQTKPGLNFNQICDFVVPVPLLADQDSFLLTLKEVDRLKGLHGGQLAVFDELSASVWHHAYRDTL